MGMPIETIGVLSTAHLSPRDCAEIEKRLFEGKLIGMFRKEGFMLYIAQPQPSLENIKSFQVPYSFGKTLGCHWLMFDQDAEPLDFLKTYKWE